MNASKFWLATALLARLPAPGAAVAAGPFTLVRDGKPAADLVVADDAGLVAREAAADLQAYIKRITGAKLIVRNESAAGSGNLVFIGKTRAAMAAGIDPARLEPEGFAIRISGNRLFIVGADRTPRDRGTWYGMSNFLEQDLGVRWLWPGELGTAIPSRATLTVSAINRVGAPTMHIRLIRDGISNLNASKLGRGMEALAMDEQKHKTMMEDSREWTSHMNLGANVEANYSHAFTHWWEEYHVQHPDYFAMMPDGSRVWPWDNTDRVKLCVSNPAVAGQWIVNARAFFKANPDAISFSASPNDNVFQGPCTCQRCESWDDPKAEKYTMNWRANGKDVVREHVSLTDRYVHFYNLVADRLAVQFPDKLVGAYAYGSWKNPPIHERDIRPNILLGYVGSNSLYVSERDRTSDLARWDEWHGLVKNLFFRPNLLHGGHGMPLVYVHKLAADMKHRAEHGMMGSDFDSLIHHWSTQGLNYYVLAKLLWNPRLDVDALIDDYTHAAFGPAAAEMKTYYSAIEKHTDEIARGTADHSDGTKDFIPLIPRFYPLPVIAGWRDQLSKALAKAPANSVYARRVRWMALGLDYAEMQSRLIALTTKPDPSPGEKQLAGKLSAEHESWYRAHLYDWSIFPPLLRWQEPAKLFGRSE